MDNKDSRTETCPDCGAATGNGDHACPAAPRADDTASIAIPPHLRDSGLFKPAWNRGDAGTPTTPPVTGSLLSRPDDLEAPRLPEAEPVDDVQSDQAPSDEVQSDEPDEPDAPEADPADANDTRIDTSFVVPPSLMGFGSLGEPQTPATAEVAGAADETTEATDTEADPDEAQVPDGVRLGDTNERPALTDDVIAALDAEAGTTGEVQDEQLSPIAAAEAAALASTGSDAVDSPAVDSPAADSSVDETATEESATDETATDETTTFEPATAVVPALDSAPTSTWPASTAETSTSVTSTAVTSTAYDTDDSAGRGGRGRRGLLVALVVVLVAALIGGGWFWWQSSQDEPVREAFETSHGAFMNASSKLVAAESPEDLSAAAEDFEKATTLLEDTRSTANGRTTSLGDAVRRSVNAQLEVSRAAQQLTVLQDEEFGAWGTARGDLKSGLEALSGVEDDIETAGGSTDGLPTPDLVEEADEIIGDAASEGAEQRTQQLTADLAAATRIKDLRGIGNRATTGATSLSGAVDSLDGTAVDTAGIARHAEVQDALSKMTRLRPATLNQWQAIRTQVERAADELPDGGTDLKVALTRADTMVTAADDAWTAWETQTESARTAKQDDIEAVKAARESVDEVLTDFEGLDSELASFIADGPQDTSGLAGPTYTTLLAAADARDALRTQVLGLGTPPEVATEVSALATALGASADTVRAAADTAATCILGCSLTSTSAWTEMAGSREAQAAAVKDAVEAWRKAATAAIKEIRQRELPEKPQV